VPFLLVFLCGCSDARREESTPSRIPGARTDGELEAGLRSVDDAHRRDPGMIPTAGDAEESREVLAHLLATHRRPLSATWSARRGGTALSIYAVLEAAEQDEILAVLRSARVQHGWNPIAVVFKEKPVTTSRATDDGASVTVRAPETVLREATIE
jgi:hypothetical protein